MSSAAATSWTLTPGSLLNFTAVALNRSPYFSTLRGPAFATTHLRAVSPGCQLNRGKFGVAQELVVSLLVGHFFSGQACTSTLFTKRVSLPWVRAESSVPAQASVMR